jgi:hypothetical protein
VIAESDLGISTADVVAAIQRLEQRGAVTGARRGMAAPALSRHAAGFLDGHSGISAEELHQARGSRGSWAAQRAVEDAVVRTLGYTTGQVAKGLGINPSRVRHRKAEGDLHAVGSGRTLVFPHWQFAGDADRLSVLPHLRRVLAMLPEGTHPLELEDFFMRPREELALRGEPRSVHEWLATGGDPQPVLHAAESMHVLG